MADKAAIRQRAVRRLTEKRLQTVAWPDIVAAFQAADMADREAFAQALYQKSAADFRRAADSVVRPYVQAQAAIVVDAALADDSLTLDELETILL